MNVNDNIIDIDGFRIGGPKTFVIAEIGSNHNQSLQLAYESIDAAQQAGADAVKFQSIDLEELYFNPSEVTKALHRKIDMEESWHKLLKDYCDKKGIQFFSSPTYLKSIDILEEIDVKFYKLASAQIGTFPQIIEKVAEKNKPVILSTGIVSYGELEKAINIFKAKKNNKFIILHCNSIYPTPYDQVNLQLMEVYKNMFGNPVGFSDHTDGIYIPIAAVAQGAKVIEKHFAMDRNLPVPDAKYSLEPKDFKQMVDGIRATEEAMQFKSRTEIQTDENQFKQSILTRLVLKVDKKSGSYFSIDDFEYKRHSEGIDCRDLIFLLEKRAKVKSNISKGKLLFWNNVELS